MMSKRTSQWVVGASIAIVLLLIGSFGYLRFSGNDYEYHGGTWDPPRTAPDLAMTDQHNNEFSLKDHSGKVVIVFFGYTFCPDFCPSTMGEVVEVLNFLGDDADHVEVAFVSVDPARDTPARLEQYMGFYNPDFYGLSASEDETERIKMEWGIRGDAQEPKDGEEYYLVDHTTSLFAVAPDGSLGLTWAYGTDSELIAEDIEHLLND